MGGEGSEAWEGTSRREKVLEGGDGRADERAAARGRHRVCVILGEEL